MNVLSLYVRREYFDAIRRGEKTVEYRLVQRWQNRVEGHTFTHVEICWGYPKRADDDRRLLFPWTSAPRQMIAHPEFGPEPVEVYAIHLTTPEPAPARAAPPPPPTALTRGRRGFRMRVQVRCVQHFQVDVDVTRPMVFQDIDAAARAQVSREFGAFDAVEIFHYEGI